MIPEPASAQRRLDEWVIHQITLECHAALGAATSLLARLAQDASDRDEALACVANLLGNASSIGEHLGWARWTRVTAHARSILPQCTFEEEVRGWIRGLFEYDPQHSPRGDLLDACPVPFDPVESAQAGRDAAPPIQINPDEGSVPVSPPPEEPVFEPDRVAAPEEETARAMRRVPTPMVVFKSVGTLRAIPASWVDHVVRKAPAPSIEQGGVVPRAITNVANRPNTPEESLRHAPDWIVSDRFEIVLRHEHAGARIRARSCLGVHWVPATPVSETSHQDWDDASVLVAGVGSVRVCGAEQITSMVA
ncbi:MAG: hypothetical protein ACYTF7_08305 [Planctomycetota bacterium]